MARNRIWAVSQYLGLLALCCITETGNVIDFSLDKQIEPRDRMTKATPPVNIYLRLPHLWNGGRSFRWLLSCVIIDDAGPKNINATDPRDFVHALLDITTDEAAQDIVANYTLSCEEVYIRTARTLLGHGHDDTLSLCQKRDFSRRLISWVLDWAAEQKRPWSVSSVDEKQFDASSISNDPSNFCMISHNEQPIEPCLTLQGFIVDTIKELEFAFHFVSLAELDLRNLKPYSDDISHYLAQSNVYTTMVEENAKCRIPIGDTEYKVGSGTIRPTSCSSMKKSHAFAVAISSDQVEDMTRKEFINLLAPPKLYQN
jgi:hypothetical protein